MKQPDESPLSCRTRQILIVAGHLGGVVCKHNNISFAFCVFSKARHDSAAVRAVSKRARSFTYHLPNMKLRCRGPTGQKTLTGTVLYCLKAPNASTIPQLRANLLCKLAYSSPLHNASSAGPQLHEAGNAERAMEEGSQRLDTPDLKLPKCKRCDAVPYRAGAKHAAARLS